MARMLSLKPARKIWVGSLVAPSMILLSWIIEAAGNTHIPSTVACTTLLTAIVLISFLRLRMTRRLHNPILGWNAARAEDAVAMDCN